MTKRETDTFEIDVECPRCHYQAKTLVGWIRTHTQIGMLQLRRHH